ncbi:aldehyde dehydrogenase (NAD+) [Bathymodiolus platifrons methanotrophic gill symbiont]|uniref:aldehyde dehydrogenase family protein n=1 Tax=Bathymodiolus platifrons methanotrophic gill symbiont TaxID=113268 RepID=UPI000B40F6B2|nr:aldehyde dehydrogenase family protein [Bathymodiolus platifrons methanotrophic gill symbiont]GAW87415.1 aldehyde dehydrogenase (NAD+) [Bathymodiolus platifrons methanotrophic gill symbiont]GFO74245.1 aldehyde dehydrogenase (NAD+) [Bathymodiolus platifrons methanotrophic gill symbiont]
MDLKKCEEQAYAFATVIKENQDELVDVMLEYEPYEAVIDQVTRSISCLEDIRAEFEDFDFELNKYATFLPVNLPLYSIVLFALIPSLYSKQVFARPPKASEETVKKIVSIIGSHISLEKITIASFSRADFLDRISDSDVVCFTGTHKNALNVRKKLQKKTIFLFNGAGINPLVVTSSAEIDLAVKKAVNVKCFNSGQDCAGPDAILVHSSLKDEFVRKLKEEVSLITVSSNYKDNRDARVGPLMDPEGTSRTGKFLEKFRMFLEYGGEIDYRQSIVFPTILVSRIDEYCNYTELFSPLWFVHEFSTESELNDYFSHDTYINHCMYASIFGSDVFDSSIIGKSIILENQSIHDVEDGNLEYGGYGSMASSISYDKKTIVKPILLSHDISEAFADRLTSFGGRKKTC